MFWHNAFNSPTMPRRNASTHTTKMLPMITVIMEPTLSAKAFWMATTMPAPTTGPKAVPRPPNSVISTTSPEVCQCASVSVAN
ncbi:hypothetical protein D9M68_839770 [compost metagenome]